MKKSLPLLTDPPIADVKGEPLVTGCNKCGPEHWATTSFDPPTDSDVCDVLVVFGRPMASSCSAMERRIIQHLEHAGKLVQVGRSTWCTESREEDSETCSVHLRYQIDRYTPAQILAFGRPAVAALLGGSPNALKLRGGWGMLGGAKVYAFPALHVATYSPVWSSVIVEDVRRAILEPPDAPRDDRVDYVSVEMPEDARAFAEAAEGNPVVYDCETYGPQHKPGFHVSLLAAQVLPQDGPRSPVYVFPYPRDADPKIRLALESGLEKSSRLIGHNIKYDLNSVAQYLGIDFANKPLSDTMVMAKMWDTEVSGDLDSLSYLVGMGGHKVEGKDALAVAVGIITKLRTATNKPITTEYSPDSTGKLFAEKCRDPEPNERVDRLQAEWSKPRTFKGQKTTFAALTGFDVPTVMWADAVLSTDSPKSFAYALMDEDVAERYCARDVYSTGLLYDYFSKKLDTDTDAQALLDSHLSRAPWAVGKMERWGIPVCREAVAVLRDTIQQAQDQVVESMSPWLPEGLDLASPDQLEKFLFRDLKIKPIKKTPKGKNSTDRDTLERLGGKGGAHVAHPIIPMLLSWRELEKLRSTYVEGLLSHTGPDGRIHPSYHITGAASGRMSCSAPNLQTIPSRGQYAKLVKDVFAAPPGRVLLQIDYKTLEVRVAAQLSGDETLAAVFARGGDPHRENAEAQSEHLWGNDFATCGGLSGEALQAEQKRRRTVMKGVVFGALYGQGAQTLAASHGIQEAEAQGAIDGVMGRCRGLKRWIAGQISSARKEGATWTYWRGRRARRRPLYEIRNKSLKDASKGERKSYNTPVQGTGHEYCLSSLVDVVQWIHDEGADAKVVAAVHDSLAIEVDSEDVEEVVSVVREIMEHRDPTSSIPTPVDVEIGPSLGTLSPWEGP